MLKRELKYQPKLTPNKRMMDRKGVERPTWLLILLGFLLIIGHISMLFAAAHNNSQTLQILSYILLVPSVIMMFILMVYNWIKNVKYFITFEEITKSDLDSYFDKINREKFIQKGLEWCTAQLGHFWIELRIKNPITDEPEEDARKDNGFVQGLNESNANENLNRKESEENRLISEEDEEQEDDSQNNKNKRSDISGLSEHICKDPKWNHAKCGKIPAIGTPLKLVAESVSSEEDEAKEPSAESNNNDVFEIFEDGKEFENFKKSKSSEEESQRSKNDNSSKHENKKYDENMKMESMKNDGFDFENLDYLES